MQLASLVMNWRKAQTTNSTATSFSALLPTVTKPERSATRGVFDLGDQAERSQNTLLVMPYGGNDNNDIMNVKVVGWDFLKDSGARGLWVPSVICEVQGTMSSTLVGVASEDVVATELFCDTLTLTTGVAVLRTGTADIDPAWFEVDVYGYRMVELTYDLGTGGDTQNALVRFTS